MACDHSLLSLIGSFIKTFDENTKDEFVCEEDGFTDALDDAVAAIELPVGDRGRLVVVIPSDEEDNTDMDCNNSENVTPDSARASRKKGTTKDKRRKRAYIADDSEDEDPRPVSGAFHFDSPTVLKHVLCNISFKWYFAVTMERYELYKLIHLISEWLAKWQIA